MPPTPAALARSNLIRWLLLALLVGAGLVLFLWYGPDVDPVATPIEMELQP
ncbi:MAG: hypothetical protein SGI84_11270 [Gemmatimonadota bacterium]|nr:hypothetical protein [Gemmatimonadota bacterium]